MIRFMVRAAEDATAVIDTSRDDRVVAMCPHLDEAIAIMAFLNGDSEHGRQMHAAFLKRLDSAST